MTQHFFEIVAREYKSGKQPAEIAAHLGKQPVAVYSALNRARRHGILPRTGRSPREPIRAQYRHNNRLLGSMRGMFDLLSDEEARWLFDQVPARATVAELLATIVRDAFDEEKQNNAQ